jgi:hypothetical protein
MYSQQIVDLIHQLLVNTSQTVHDGRRNPREESG